MSARFWAAYGALARDRAGTVMVEFALLMPVLCILFIGSYEAANLILADLKLEAAAETATDLVAQTTVNTVLQSSDFTNITNAVKEVLTPLTTSGTQLKVAYASITYSTGTAVIDWHLEVNGATAISVGSLPNSASAGNLGSATNGSTDSFIVSQLTYSYTSPISYVLSTSYTLTESAFNRPRYMNCVPTYLNTNSTCP
ncbi:MAG: pilus assembly protein [Alphaproteobacteria bacterium]|nr:pilus assembly protein [Alphaproteobacteria bacterium]